MADTNVFVTDLPAEMDEDSLKGIFGAYGTVTYGKMFQSKGKPTCSAIVEFASIDEATWVVENVSGTVPDGLSAPVTVAFKTKKPKGDKGGGKGKGWSDDWGKGRGGDSWGKSGGGGWGKGAGGDSWGKGGGGGSWGKGGGDSWGGAKGPWQPMFQKTWDGGKGKGKTKGPKIQDPTKVAWVGNIPAEATFKELLELGNHAGTAKWAEVWPSKKGKGGPATGVIGYGTAEEATQAIQMLNGATVGSNTIQTDVYTSKSA